mmetsp:Transcript_11772/g.25919  ORF Transcript_11772/g.25919 Transcript_11772/m.25919 type:complete len:98 (+) Transcript_11772:162-455(+)
MMNNRPNNSTVSNCNESIVPLLINHEINPKDPTTDPITKAALPATDLLWLNDHLFALPNLRPIRSASPSPTASVAIDTIPIGESVQKKKVVKSNART